jgi:hypothetical protein
MKKTSVSPKKRCESKLWLSGRQIFNMVYLHHLGVLTFSNLINQTIKIYKKTTIL